MPKPGGALQAAIASLLDFLNFSVESIIRITRWSSIIKHLRLECGRPICSGGRTSICMTF